MPPTFRYGAVGANQIRSDRYVGYRECVMKIDTQNSSSDRDAGSTIPFPRYSRPSPRRLADVEVYEIRCAWLEGVRQQCLARQYGVAQSVISKLITGRTYRRVPSPLYGPERIVPGPLPLPWRDLLSFEQAVNAGASFVEGWHLARPRPRSLSAFVDWLAYTPDRVVDAVVGLPYRAAGRPVPRLTVGPNLSKRIDAIWGDLKAS